ncbi:MAG: site-2 protease family protein [Candidatus Thermoplasmatota archaeon]|nr:site-2 protease family protein [Candidatus Thermoplasmatota archaeon]
MARDPRADILEDDLFPKKRANIHRIHANPSPSTTVKQWMSGINNHQPVQLHKGKIWHFSDEEKRQLMLATAAFTFALGLLMAGGILGISAQGGFEQWIAIVLLSMPVMLIAVGPAFILHEIGHKIVAKKYGCWAEFRVDPSGLKFGIAMAAIIGILFMAPGAVMVAGLVTRRQNGHIAIAGPAVNFGLFLIGIPIGGIILGLTGATESAPYLEAGAINLKAMVFDIVYYWILFNLVLGLFNLIPFGPLDGAKIKDWNEPVWFISFMTFIVIGYVWLDGIFNPIDDVALRIAEWF